MNCFLIFEGLVTSVETGFSPIVGRTLLMSAGVTLRQPLIATCQINRSLRSLAVVLAFSSFDHYMKILELYFVYKNVKTRQSFNKQ